MVAKKKRKITYASAKNKARNQQKRVAEYIGKLLKLPCKHQLPKEQQDQALIASREMGQAGVDVVLRGKAYDMFKYDIECKNQETWAVPAWIKQAKKNTSKKRNWLLVAKRKDLSEDVVVLPIKHFFEILTAAYTNNK